MHDIELLKLNPFPLIINTGVKSCRIPDSLTIEEAIMAPKLDRDFALQILCACQNICVDKNTSSLQSADVLVLREILDRNSCNLWEELTEELSDSKYNPRLYTVFSQHEFRREFIGEQKFDIESLSNFLKWSGNYAKERIFYRHVKRGRKYSFIDNEVHISCSLFRHNTEFLFYCYAMLPVQLKYVQSNKALYENRHKIIIRLQESLEILKKRNKKTSFLNDPDSLANLFSRFSRCDNSRLLAQ
jgi:hypothetical protein